MTRSNRRIPRPSNNLCKYRPLNAAPTPSAKYLEDRGFRESSTKKTYIPEAFIGAALMPLTAQIRYTSLKDANNKRNELLKKGKQAVVIKKEMGSGYKDSYEVWYK